MYFFLLMDNRTLNMKCISTLYQDFESCDGIEEVAHLIRDKQLDENLRYF